MTSSTDARPSPVRHDLTARPAYHRKREYIVAHLSIDFAALAVTRFIEDRTGWSIKHFVRTARHYGTTQIRARPVRRETQLARRTADNMSGEEHPHG
jgi:hypothetical protein